MHHTEPGYKQRSIGIDKASGMPILAFEVDEVHYGSRIRIYNEFVHHQDNRNWDWNHLQTLEKKREMITRAQENYQVENSLKGF